MRLPEGTRAELIDGELFVSPSPRLRHQRISLHLATRLADFAEGQGLGLVYYAPIDVHLPSGDIVQPDVVFVASGNSDILQDWIRGAPDLVVEIISPDGAERDRIVKKDLYARNGVREYWIIDDQNRAVEVFILRGRVFEPEGSFREGENVKSTVLAGLSLAVGQIFAP